MCKLTPVPLLTKAKVAAADFERFRTLPATTSESFGNRRFGVTGQVSFNKVSFVYPSRPDTQVFRDLSFKLDCGELIAIVGPSGSGKSTIASLLQRLYDPTSGSIRLGGHDLGTADIRFARDSIAVVSQQPHLFDASVADNIRYGGKASTEKVVSAAREARIHDFVASLPQGYQTRLGENAALISGGQAQRLQIARALLRNARILIMDEATSALDVENQHGILDTLVGIKAVSQVEMGGSRSGTSRECSADEAEPRNHLHHTRSRRYAPVRPYPLPGRRQGRRGGNVHAAYESRGRIFPVDEDGGVAVARQEG